MVGSLLLIWQIKNATAWLGARILFREEILKAIQPDEAYFWGTYNGAEIDLVMVKDGRMLGVECKMVDAPRLTPSMRIAIEDLKLEQIVVYPGKRRYALAENVSAVPLEAAADGMAGLFPPR